MRSHAWAVLLAACLLAPAAAAQGSVTVEQPWARPTAPRQTTGAAYMRLFSPAGDRLVHASSPVAVRAEVHEMRMDGDVMRMREVGGGLELPPGEAVALAPGGLHVMLIGLRERLAVGQHFPLKLEFERGGSVEVEVAVGVPDRPASPAGHRH